MFSSSCNPKFFAVRHIHYPGGENDDNLPAVSPVSNSIRTQRCEVQICETNVVKQPSPITSVSFEWCVMAQARRLSSDHFPNDSVVPFSDHCRTQSTETVLPHGDHYYIETVAPSGDHHGIDIVVPSSDHCCTEIVPPSSDHYGTTKIVPPSDHLHTKRTYQRRKLEGETFTKSPLATPLDSHPLYPLFCYLGLSYLSCLSLIFFILDCHLSSLSLILSYIQSIPYFVVLDCHPVYRLSWIVMKPVYRLSWIVMAVLMRKWQSEFSDSSYLVVTWKLYWKKPTQFNVLFLFICCTGFCTHTPASTGSLRNNVMRSLLKLWAVYLTEITHNMYE